MKFAAKFMKKGRTDTIVAGRYFEMEKAQDQLFSGWRVIFKPGLKTADKGKFLLYIQPL